MTATIYHYRAYTVDELGSIFEIIEEEIVTTGGQRAAHRMAWNRAAKNLLSYEPGRRTLFVQHVTEGQLNP